ncbi:MAG: purine-binding chemotaxis protein CheW [Deltaproteobacteria bacterium]|nr:purine-binding chemotaxis protein CheW [Deltaproteobacteria bacterium]
MNLQYTGRDNDDAELSLEGDQFVTFSLATEEYGVSILLVQEIIGYRTLTQIPGVPSFVKGMLNLRGAVVPVIDLRVRFGMTQREYDKFTVIVIVVVQGRTMGIIVDGVSDVVSFEASQVQPTPPVAAAVRTDYISGMGQKDDKFVILLDVDKMLSLEELEILSTVN